jgi:hypothetical protein
MRIAIISAALLSLGLGQPAMAQSPACFPKEALLARLKEKYGEEPMVTGKSKSGEASLVLTAAADGGFTAIVVAGDMACMVFSGVDFAGPRPKSGKPT